MPPVPLPSAMTPPPRAPDAPAAGPAAAERGVLGGGVIAASAEVARSAVPWGDRGVYLVRLPFDQEEAPVAAGVVPVHNLIETSALARQLTAERSPSIWLVCADVAFSDLAPPELDPGAAAWGPTYSGVRIGRSR
ncbi:hypothetical protein [Sorangium sp. So ce388]|uniref:hypothetical protein n=1 Tax=Sorangium sp. So ce388 TaxID=3133309 RepID=UPI003F5C3A53